MMCNIYAMLWIYYLPWCHTAVVLKVRGARWCPSFIKYIIYHKFGVIKPQKRHYIVYFIFFYSNSMFEIVYVMNFLWGAAKGCNLHTETFENHCHTKQKGIVMKILLICLFLSYVLVPFTYLECIEMTQPCSFSDKNTYLTFVCDIF